MVHTWVFTELWSRKTVLLLRFQALAKLKYRFGRSRHVRKPSPLSEERHWDLQDQLLTPLRLAVSRICIFGVKKEAMKFHRRHRSSRLRSVEAG